MGSNERYHLVNLVMAPPSEPMRRSLMVPEPVWPDLAMLLFLWAFLVWEVIHNSTYGWDGLNALTEAMAAADQYGVRHYEPEMHRLKGELLLSQDHSNATEAQSCFQRAIEIARNQSAKSLELRATTSLARLLAKEGRVDEARAMLAEIYGWFTEGFDTADIKDAKALLDEFGV